MTEQERQAVVTLADYAKRLAIWGAAKHWLAREQDMLHNRWTWKNGEPMLGRAEQKLMGLALEVRGRGIRGARSARWPQNGERTGTAEATHAEDVDSLMRGELFRYGLLVRQLDWRPARELLPDNLRVVLAGNGPSVWIDIIVRKDAKPKSQLLGSDWDGQTQPWDGSANAKVDDATRLGLDAFARTAYRTAVIEIQEKMRRLATASL